MPTASKSGLQCAPLHRYRTNSAALQQITANPDCGCARASPRRRRRDASVEQRYGHHRLVSGAAGAQRSRSAGRPTPPAATARQTAPPPVCQVDAPARRSMRGSSAFGQRGGQVHTRLGSVASDADWPAPTPRPATGRAPARSPPATAAGRGLRPLLASISRRGSRPPCPAPGRAAMR